MAAEFLSRLQGSTSGLVPVLGRLSLLRYWPLAPSSCESKTLSEQVRHLDKEGAAVPAKSWLQRSTEAIKTIAA